MRPVGGARHAGRLFPLVAGFPGVLPGFRPPCWGGCGGMGQAGASILKRHTFEIARHHVGQVGHVGRTTSKSKAHQRFSPPDMAFPMSGASRACRARPTSRGVMRDGWEGMGRMRPVGGMERRTPRRAALALVGALWGFLLGLWPQCGRVRRHGRCHISLISAKLSKKYPHIPPIMCSLTPIIAHFPPFLRTRREASHTIQPFLIAQQKAASPRHAVYGKMNATPLFMRQVQQKAAVAPLTFRARCIISKTCRQSVKSASAGRASYSQEAFLFPTTRSVPSPYICRISPPVIITIGNSPVSGIGHGSHQ